MNGSGKPDGETVGERFALDDQRRRVRWPITVILGFGFGSLMLVALASVLLLGVIGARENTAALLRDKAELTLSSVSDRIEAHLRPVEAQVAYIAASIASGDVDLDDDESIRRFFAGALAATPQVAGLAFVRPDGLLWRVERDRARLRRETWAEDPRAMAALEEARRSVSGRWVAPAWAPLLRRSVLTYRAPVRSADGFSGLLVAGITIHDLSRYARSLSEDLNQTVFILYDFETVLAHPGLVDRQPHVTAQKPLPAIGDVGDPVLASIWDPGREPLDVAAPLSRGQGHVVRVGDAEHVYIYRDLRLEGNRPWTVGVHMPGSVVDEEIVRLRNMVIAGVLLLILFLSATFAIGHWLSAPVTRLAAAAAQVRNLDLGIVARLSPSRVREFDEAAHAFNAMVVGLRWFETYLPRKLVGSLIASGEFRAPPSEERVVTVLFTDIVGFSSFAEGRPAQEIAAFLNRHFTLVGHCIEDQDGTIDKYIGDGVMAFWGAPVAQADQAVRACRAATAMAAALDAENAARAESGEPPVRMRIGIHTGRAIVGNIGSPGRLNYTLVGDAVNIAQRLEQLGKDLEVEVATLILISEPTADALPAETRLADEGMWALRGRDAPQRVFRLVGS